MNKHEAMGLSIVVGGALALLAIVYIFNIYPNQKFCEKEFPDVSRFVCMFSDKYKYDGD